MRFMVMVKATKESEEGQMPTEEGLAAMGRFNEEMVKAGIMLDGAGLKPSAQGARVRFAKGKLGDTKNRRSVIDGPFAETKELVAGYWIIQVKDLAEAVAWMKRCPSPHDEECEIEIRPFYELEDFGESPAIDQHRKLAEQMKK
jgi:hypothetical protein